LFLSSLAHSTPHQPAQNCYLPRGPLAVGAVSLVGGPHSPGSSPILRVALALTAAWALWPDFLLMHTAGTDSSSGSLTTWAYWPGKPTVPVCLLPLPVGPWRQEHCLHPKRNRTGRRSSAATSAGFVGATTSAMIGIGSNYVCPYIALLCSPFDSPP
jgi:hypothetical protein